MVQDRHQVTTDNVLLRPRAQCREHRHDTSSAVNHTYSAIAQLSRHRESPGRQRQSVRSTGGDCVASLRSRAYCQNHEELPSFPAQEARRVSTTSPPLPVPPFMTRSSTISTSRPKRLKAMMQELASRASRRNLRKDTEASGG